MITITKTVEEFSKIAAQSFIQTAVFVDDRIYQQGSADTGELKTVLSPPRRQLATNNIHSAMDNDQGNTEADSDEDTVSDACDIIDSFSNKQIICTLCQPKQGSWDSQINYIVRLCNAADVVILDWDFFGDDGEHALKLIGKLVIQAVRDVPEQLRLILVYTRVNLQDVADKIDGTLCESVGDGFKRLEEQDNLAFCTNSTRVAVLGKPGRKRPEIDSGYIVDEKDLADAAVEQFAKLALGLLQATILQGLAEIRKNSRKMLSRFSNELDPAFLTHRALCLPTKDAYSHIIPLLVSEIEAVFEDVLPDSLIPEEVLKDWCTSIWKPGDHLKEILGNDSKDKKIEVATDICTIGFNKANKKIARFPIQVAPKIRRKLELYYFRLRILMLTTNLRI